MRIATAALAASLMCCLLLGGLPAALGQPVQGRVVVEPSITYQRLLGYGQGSMDQANPRWYRQLSEAERERLLDRLYTLGDDGLGLSICRTYLTAGDAPGHAHWDREPGGARGGLGYEPQDGEYNWEGHADTLWHAQGAARRGALMVAFWNSPPWWMTISGCTSGAAGGTANLRAGLEDRFARHMAEVLRHYRDAWGVDFDRVSPLNEPESDWWKEGGGQDGCHVDARQAAVIVAALQQRLGAAGLKATLQAPEAAFAGSLGYVDEVLADGAAYDAVTDLTSHQYIADFHGLRRWPTRGRLHHKGVWMSEWGDWTSRGMDLALNYARKISEAHRVMQAEAWCMWEPAFLVDVADGRAEPNLAWYAVAQFSRFARPGMTAVEVTDTACRTTGYVDAEARRLVLVTLNDGAEPATLSYDLSGFTGLSEARGWRTCEGQRLAPVAVALTAAAFEAELSARSVTTFEVHYEATRAPLVANGGFETGRLAPWQGEPATMTGVQDNYPQGGSCDAYLDLRGQAAGRIWQDVKGLEAGRRYRLTAACACSGMDATLAVSGQGLAESATASGGGYQLKALEFTAPADGAVTVSYSAGPSDQEHPWATLDNVRIGMVQP
jgi:O-glycosyl hydrolase